MNALTKILAASAAALSIGAIAAPANAGVYLDFADSNSGATFTWTRDADTIGGDLLASGQVMLNIFDNTLTDGPLSILANFNLEGRDDTTGTLNAQLQYEQWEVAGQFSFTADSDFSYNGTDYAAGTNLLSAVFTGADFGGAGNRGFFLAQKGLAGAQVNFSSDILSQAAQYTMDTFSFNLSQAIPNFNITGCNTPLSICDASIESNGGNIRGTFSAAIPEPGTWALMILGFGGAGAMLRSRRQSLVAA
ncbi:PEPxxWA-CTERM sorting domain-containing protein [Phenylobacterium kunshanense]|uniref:Ice-binding protein C-terminal domain-containing protein n=1 Tax=Phenylobacterium kunshanense TaxID=1445034 RepID=A0A328BKQ7_9CAUL|nr:PEPxxWA-CTERM sorting domain-containing protein [Phenylobacterium kunshanense]RAK66524.1 hypothetical protein DJ019_09805 [Phenylobacterium kunshanense]